MTPPATPAQLADLVQQEQADEAAALEDQTAKDADGGAGAALAVVFTGAAAAWVTSFGSLTAVGGGTALAAYLARLRRDVDQAGAGLGRRAARVTEQALADAVEMGVRHTITFAYRAEGRRGRRIAGVVPRDAIEAARAIAATVREQLRLTKELLSPQSVAGQGWSGVTAGLAAARRAASLVRSAVAWCIHRAINDGAAQAIAELGARRLWVTERDACVVCLAYAGRIADLDGRFPGGLSMDPRARSMTAAAVEGPPKHPNCRCRLVAWRDEWARPGTTSLPDLLRAQAWQSIASGRGRPTESRAARIRAARTLAAQRGVPDRLRRQARTTAGRT